MHANAFEELKTKTSFKDKFTWWFNGVIHNLISSPFIIYLSEISKITYLNKSVIKHTLIPNAITADYFNMPLNRITHNKLVYIGVLNNRKNIYYLLSVLKKLVNKNIYYHLDILGDFVDEQYREKVTQFIKDENLSEFIHFRGWVNKSELLNYLKESDIMVMTSMQETLPMVIAESMAAGKVVISSNVGGISKMIHHQNDGYLFDLSNPAELENILVNLYNNHEKINSIIANARNSSKKYLSDTVAADTMKFYEVCLNGR
jgi:glycosyltransferase involved in cell wall biosynthesis